jgi:hypothetical protein
MQKPKGSIHYQPISPLIQTSGTSINFLYNEYHRLHHSINPIADDIDPTPPLTLLPITSS